MSNRLTPGQATGEMPSLKRPTEADWERHRPLITQLYVDQSLKLNEVMATMLQHGHKASPRTYKNWIAKWKLEKKHKGRDMVAIRRKDLQRNRIGKKSLFRVRGRVVTMEQVEDYFRRKKHSSQIDDAPTPSDVSCRTPSPACTLRPSEESGFIFPSGCKFAAAPVISRCSMSLGPNGTALGLSHGDWSFSQQLEVDDTIIQFTIQDVYNILSDSPTISRSPLPPQALLVPEHLFYSIKIYCDGSFESGVWSSYETRYNTSSDLVDLCMTAINLRKRGLFVESRRTLSKMFNLVGDLLQAKGLQTLDCFLDIFLLLIENGNRDTLLCLRNYIGAMAKLIVEKDHPWSYICQNLCFLDEKVLEQAAGPLWNCVIDKLVEFQGLLSEDAVNAKLNFIYRIYGSGNYLEEERLFRELLAEFEAGLGAMSRHTLHIRSLIIFPRAQELKDVSTEIMCKRYIAWSQFYQQKPDAAEATLRDAIEMAGEAYGTIDPELIKYMLELEGWLREWGREQEADALKADIDERIGRDEIDEEIELMDM